MRLPKIKMHLKKLSGPVQLFMHNILLNTPSDDSKNRFRLHEISLKVVTNTLPGQHQNS